MDTTAIEHIKFQIGDEVHVRERDGRFPQYLVCDIQGDQVQVQPIRGWLKRKKWVGCWDCLTWKELNHHQEVQREIYQNEQDEHHVSRAEVPVSRVLDTLEEAHTGYELTRVQDAATRSLVGTLLRATYDGLCHLKAVEDRLEELKEENDYLRKQLEKFMESREGRY